MERPLDTDESTGWVEDCDHPRNWPKWKKNAQILMVSFHSMGASFMAAGTIPILILGVAPVFWKPFTTIYGRYPIFLFSVFGCMLCNLGGAFCSSYGAQMVTRVFAAICVCPPLGVGTGVITDLCEPHERAQNLAAAGPLIMGFVSGNLGRHWVFYILALLNFVQFMLYVLLGDETIYPADRSLRIKNGGGFFAKYRFRRLNACPLTKYSFCGAFSIVFCYANIAIIVEMPSVFGQKFGLNAQQIGLQFLVVIIGSLIGEQLAGPTSDWFLKAADKRKGSHIPADRLWLSYVGFAAAMAGLLTWGFQLDNASSTWNVTPLIGVAIASFGNQIVMTILISFSIDSHPELATDVGICLSVAPFYLPAMFKALDFAKAAGVMCVLIVVAALVPIIAIHVAASHHRAAA
ncbi:major facilitator superfamily domain-containing protein [Aspergillus transmontanensis]|uniref:Major facilitator superfamily domain-containing protein n=1 Tax=Aspergillus transmontanensis TaxID=1034304 RepID=A0A5N6VXF4_9EURO|nr:major facilitator superfamily domain-containing protein [Aspergillus transmontanensis]